MANKVQNRVSLIEQGRAARAYEMVEEAKQALGVDDKKYKSYVKKIPMLIKTNGLAATLAFVRSKMGTDSKQRAKETPYGRIYSQIAAWLREKELLTEGKDLVEEVITLPSPQYRSVTVEVLGLFSWLRRFAEGLIEGEPEEN
ncbi:CRISPR-associated protein, Cmr5 [Acididesulfobacillus acetoxydans]|uniref:CRISPR type III-B/RAMP module-associated protein Cmr5 n=1 Tax=Acididesulfobacillus acetoxydans TaxID=1561005 RepID=A0A8S0WHN3_9FIRM|nr:type III-B CRISPR module-associated protein Cmr5 [Acididesulfobacillus acetoxydans]CAA7602812.1 CRISPR-associated protein, Cmr5 [Acididesulfobacillus acetoxydans]CEJ06009.1 CRISPR-associated protein, Cmr5 [Acididesulfobacillus acetoxydans]